MICDEVPLTNSLMTAHLPIKALKTYSVAAAVYVKISGENDTSKEGDERCQGIHDDDDDRDRQCLYEGCCSTIQDNDPRENTCKHSIVDAAISPVLDIDGITDQSCCNEDEHELQRAHSELRH
jgi:hypothetical protein